jgi:hypothetical protein
MFETSMILEQELRSWVGKIGVGIGLHFLGFGNTLFTLSLLQCTITWGPPGLSRCLKSLIKNLGQTNRKKERRKESDIELLRN